MREVRGRQWVGHAEGVCRGRGEEGRCRGKEGRTQENIHHICRLDVRGMQVGIKAPAGARVAMSDPQLCPWVVLVVLLQGVLVLCTPC